MDFFKFIVIVAVTFSNFWIWKIISNNLLIGILLILASILGFIFISSKTNRLFLICLSLVFTILVVITINVAFDKNLTIVSSQMRLLLDKRHQFFSSDLGKVFKNKLALNYYVNWYPKISKFHRNISYVVDLNSYFFESHPRERPGFNEFSKYPFSLQISKRSVPGKGLAIKKLALKVSIFFAKSIVSFISFIVSSGNPTT